MFTDEDIGDLSFEARWLFAGLFTQADREGRLEDRPRKLKVEVMPYDKVSIEDLLRELTEARFISRYQVDGKPYIHIRTFWKHQHFNVREPESQLPAPPGVNGSTVHAPYEHHTGTIPAPARNAGREGKGEGKEGKGEVRQVPAPDTHVREPKPSLSESFLDELQAKAEYAHLDVRFVYKKYKNYCEAEGVAERAGRFVSWLNREKGDLRDDDRGSSDQAARVAASLGRDN